jgi:predicted NBD/HSP70 family sugar kinase
VVRTIWQHPRISRAGIAERLGLDKSTVTYQVNRLIEQGIIHEVEEGAASVRGGRRPIYLAMNPAYGRLIGIEIQVETWVAVAVDLSGMMLGECRGHRLISAEGFGRDVQAIIQEAVAELCPDRDRLLGVGIGTGGLIDLKKSRVRFSVPLGIDKPLDFAKLVAEHVSVPCFIENDANCCAWGELAFDRGLELRDFLFALVEYRKDDMSLGQYGGLGVGFGIVLGGKVYSGAHGNAGEFRSAFCEGRGKLQFSLTREELSRIDRDPELLSRVTDELARNMGMLVNTMDFQRVFIGGDIEGLGVDFPSLLRRRLEENWMYPFPKDVDIRYSSMGGRSVAYGAAGMMLDRLLSERFLPAPGLITSAPTP